MSRTTTFRHCGGDALGERRVAADGCAPPPEPGLYDAVEVKAGRHGCPGARCGASLSTVSKPSRSRTATWRTSSPACGCTASRRPRAGRRETGPGQPDHAGCRRRHTMSSEGKAHHNSLNSAGITPFDVTVGRGVVARRAGSRRAVPGGRERTGHRRVGESAGRGADVGGCVDVQLQQVQPDAGGGQQRCQPVLEGEVPTRRPAERVEPGQMTVLCSGASPFYDRPDDGTIDTTQASCPSTATTAGAGARTRDFDHPLRVGTANACGCTARTTACAWTSTSCPRWSRGPGPERDGWTQTGDCGSSARSEF